MKQSSDCLFCKIIEGKISSSRVYEDAEFVVIQDIQPQAKIHLLVIPKRHVESLDTAFAASDPLGCAAESEKLLGRLFSVATCVARQNGLLPGGFRSVMNTNADAGQTVYHLHLHLLGGQSLQGNFGQ